MGIAQRGPGARTGSISSSSFRLAPAGSPAVCAYHPPRGIPSARWRGPDRAGKWVDALVPIGEGPRRTPASPTCRGPTASTSVSSTNRSMSWGGRRERPPGRVSVSRAAPGSEGPKAPRRSNRHPVAISGGDAEGVGVGETPAGLDACGGLDERPVRVDGADGLPNPGHEVLGETGPVASHQCVEHLARFTEQIDASP